MRAGSVWVASKLLLESWEHYLPNEKPPTFEQLTRALKSLLVPTHEARYRPQTGGGAKTSYQRLRPEELAAWCESEGVTDLPALLARDTESAAA